VVEHVVGRAVERHGRVLEPVVERPEAGAELGDEIVDLGVHIEQDRRADVVEREQAGAAIATRPLGQTGPGHPRTGPAVPARRLAAVHHLVRGEVPHRAAGVRRAEWGRLGASLDPARQHA